MAVENKAKAEQVHIKGRNHFDVVSQIVEKYNASEGWAVKKVIPNVVTIEVILERSTEQGEVDADKRQDKATTNSEKASPKKTTTQKKTTSEKQETVDESQTNGTTPPKESKEEVELTETTTKKK